MARVSVVPDFTVYCITSSENLVIDTLTESYLILILCLSMCRNPFIIYSEHDACKMKKVCISFITILSITVVTE